MTEDMLHSRFAFVLNPAIVATELRGTEAKQNKGPLPSTISVPQDASGEPAEAPEASGRPEPGKADIAPAGEL